MAPFTPMAERFDTLSDLRSTIHITYSLPEVLFIVYASILSGYEEWESMEDFAKYNISWFRQFFPYRWGIPSHYTLKASA